MSDYLIRATAAQGQIRAFAAITTDTVEFARNAHNTSPVVTAALGRLLTGAAMMGSTMKAAEDLLTIKIDSDGPMKGMLVTADANGTVKGYAYEPQVIIPANEKGKLDVAGAVGIGVLSVIKDLGLKEPYVGQTILISSEIAEDLTYYYATSEQTPSSIALGVLMNRNNTVRQAGGFMIQLMPGVADEVIDALEAKIGSLDSVTSMLDRGMSAEQILEYVLGDFDLIINDSMPVQFACNCSKERVSRAIASISKKDIRSMIADGQPIEVNCHFCNTNYVFDVEELKQML